MRGMTVLMGLLLLLSPVFAHARPASPAAKAMKSAAKFAQANPKTDDDSSLDDSYDPFADYSEFDQDSDEEADINFFRNGRFVTLGFAGGWRGWTEGMGKAFHPSFHFGVFLSYFFDLRFALQFTFLTGDHAFAMKAPSQTITGNVGIQSFGLDFKYYINTQNVTRGLAAFNPYLIGGFSQLYRTANVNNVTAYGKESAMGFDIGAGIELPLMRNKMFCGLQAMYQMVNFKDENSEVVLADGEHTGQYLTGDTYTFLGTLGVNF